MKVVIELADYNRCPHCGEPSDMWDVYVQHGWRDRVRFMCMSLACLPHRRLFFGGEYDAHSATLTA